MQSNKPKILYLCHKSPAAYNEGGRMRCAFIADALHGCGDLCVWVMDDVIMSTEELTRRDVPWEQRDFGRLDRTIFKKIAWYFHGLLSIFPALACAYMDSWRFRQLLDKLDSFKPDIIVLGDSQLGILSSIVRKYIPTAKVVVDTHNVDSILTARIARQTKPFFQKMKCYLLACNVRLSEARAVSGCHEVWATSTDDATAFKKMKAKEVFVIPNTIDFSAYIPAPLIGNRSFAFCGIYAYPPNEQAGLFLIKMSHDLYSQGCKHILRLIGRLPTKKMFDEARGVSYIEIVGEVDSAIDEIVKSDVFAAPLFAGSGTKFKIIEALALGRAVITTEIGNEGLGLHSNINAIISDADNFLYDVRRLLDTTFETTRIAADGRRWVNSNLDPESIRKKIIERVTDKGYIK